MSGFFCGRFGFRFIGFCVEYVLVILMEGRESWGIYIFGFVYFG